MCYLLVSPLTPNLQHSCIDYISVERAKLYYSFRKSKARITGEATRLSISPPCSIATALNDSGLKAPALDAHLVEIGAKGALGPLAHATVGHRLAGLEKWHRLRHRNSPTDDHRVRTLCANEPFN